MSVFLGVRHAPYIGEWDHCFPEIFLDILHSRTQDEKQQPNNVAGDQTRCAESFFSGSTTPLPCATLFVIRMLTRDLFAVANVFVDLTLKRMTEALPSIYQSYLSPPPKQIKEEEEETLVSCRLTNRNLYSRVYVQWL